MNGNAAAESAIESVVTILPVSDGQTNPFGSGLIVRSDGYILTAYHLVKDAKAIQVRLRNGEIYDKAEIVSFDERRNVALIRINAAGLRSIPNGTVEESQVGSKIFVVANPNGQTLIDRDKLLNGVQLADSIAGAGKGYRVLQFDTVENAVGALVLDENGRALGIVTTNPEIKNHSIAVPFSSILGLIRSINPPAVNSSMQISTSAVPQNTPYPIPQVSVKMPERGVTQLTPRGPGSVVVKPLSPKEILAASKTIYVTSETVFLNPINWSTRSIKDLKLTIGACRLPMTAMWRI